MLKALVLPPMATTSAVAAAATSHGGICAQNSGSCAAARSEVCLRLEQAEGAATEVREEKLRGRLLLLQTQGELLQTNTEPLSHCKVNQYYTNLSVHAHAF